MHKQYIPGTPSNFFNCLGTRLESDTRKVLSQRGKGEDKSEPLRRTMCADYSVGVLSVVCRALFRNFVEGWRQN